MTSILLFGSNYIAASILKQLLYTPEAKIIVVDRRDPHFILNQDVLASIQNLSAAVPDLTKNIDYKKSFGVHHNDSLSFLFLNPVTDSTKLLEELNNIPNIDIIIDVSAMNDPLYSENNIMDSCTINTFYPTAIFSVLSKLSYQPRLYINVSSGLVYGVQPESNLPAKEDTIPNPTGMRAASILAKENIISGLARANDIPFIHLRIGTPIGYYTPLEGVANQFVKSQLLNQPLTVHGDGTQARDFFDIVNLSSLIFRIVADVTGGNLLSTPSSQNSEEIEKETRLTGDEYIESIKNQIYNIGGHKSNNEAVFNLITLDRIITTALGKVSIPEVQGKIIIKNSKKKTVAWRNNENIEKNVRIQMNVDKAIKTLHYDPEYNILDTFKTQVIPYIAHNFLDYTDEEMDDLKKTLRV